MNVMVDIETGGTEPGSVILSIGAAVIRDSTAEPSTTASHFYQVIDVQSCVALGMQFSASTLRWWMEQTEVARSVWGDEHATPLPRALYDFSYWLQRLGEPCVWANSPAFDLVLLRDAYRRCGMDAPWSYRNERCYRTALTLREPVYEDFSGVPHNALDDAIRQARRLLAAYPELGQD